MFMQTLSQRQRRTTEKIKRPPADTQASREARIFLRFSEGHLEK